MAEIAAKLKRVLNIVSKSKFTEHGADFLATKTKLAMYRKLKEERVV